MEEVLRGLSLLGPTLNDLVVQVSEIENRLAGLSTSVAAKADADALEALRADLKEFQASSPTSEALRNMEQKVSKISNDSEEQLRNMESLDVKILKISNDSEEQLRNMDVKISKICNETADLSKLHELRQSLADACSSHDQQIEALNISHNQALTQQIQDLRSSLEKELDDVQRSLYNNINDDVLKQLAALQDSLGAKADKSFVPSLDDFDNKGILLKANRTEVPTFDQVPTLVQSQFDALQSRVKAQEVSTAGDIDQLRAMVAGRAEKDSVPSREEIQELRAEVSQKAQMSAIPDVAGFEEQLAQKADSTLISKISARLDHKADLKWTQDSIRSLSDILLPVARAVRGLPAGQAGALGSGVLGKADGK